MVEGTVAVPAATADLAQQVERLAPFGAGNEEPVFALPRARVVRADRVGKEGNTIRAFVEGEGGGPAEGDLLPREGRPAGRGAAGPRRRAAAPLRPVAGRALERRGYRLPARRGRRAGLRAWHQGRRVAAQASAMRDSRSCGVEGAAGPPGTSPQRRTGPLSRCTKPLLA